MSSTSLASTVIERPGTIPATSPPPIAASRICDLPRIVVVITCIVSGALALILSRTVFSQLSVNNDEAVYLLQAKALAHGHLFPPASHLPGSFRPWLSVIHGEHYVLKYTPVIPAFLAVSLVLTGGYAMAFAIWTAGFVTATFFLAKEVTGNRGTAAIAAVVVAASPLTIVQSALALPYLPFTVLVEFALWSLLAGSRRESSRLLLIAGLSAGLAFAARPFDGVLLLAPVIGWVVWEAGRRRTRLIRAVLMGAAVPGAGLAWFNWAATGSPLRLPFSLFESGDTLGFGGHRLFPEERAHHFGLAQGWQGLARHLNLLAGGWAFGGALLIGLVALALIRRRLPAAGVALLGGAALMTLGYLFFWGTWNAAVVWGGIRYLGPYYLLPTLGPLSIAGAIGLRELLPIRWLAVPACGAACAISAFALVPAAQANAALNAANVQLANAIAAKGRSLVFVATYPSYLLHPTAVISNDSPAGGRTVFALAKGRDDFGVLNDFADRPVYELRLLGEYGKHPHAGYGATLQRARLVTGATLTLRIGVRVPKTAATAHLVVAAGARRTSFDVTPGDNAQVQVSFEQGAVDTTRAVTVTLVTSDANGTKKSSPRLLISLGQTQQGRLTVLAPDGAVLELGPLTPPALFLASASGG